jgi:hypothetical protein
MTTGAFKKIMRDFRFWLIVVGALLVVTTVLYSVPGHLTWDSGTYHMMVRTLLHTGGFYISNGYSEFSSPLLAIGKTIIKNGNLVGQYPEFYTFISLPFYALFGIRGFVVLNALAFIGICILILHMARWFTSARGGPVAAAIIYGFATYAVEFTQSSYPHLTSTFLICAAVWLIWSVEFDRDYLLRRGPFRLQGTNSRCLMAGVLYGVAIGVRLDSAFAALALVLPFVIFRSIGFRNLFTFLVGIVPALVGLMYINAVKFGEVFPFSYGKDGSGYTSSTKVYIPLFVVFVLIGPR